jgi:hypothetical protein
MVLDIQIYNAWKMDVTSKFHSRAVSDTNANCLDVLYKGQQYQTACAKLRQWVSSNGKKERKKSKGLCEILESAQKIVPLLSER